MGPVAIPRDFGGVTCPGFFWLACLGCPNVTDGATASASVSVMESQDSSVRFQKVDTSDLKVAPSPLA